MKISNLKLLNVTWPNAEHRPSTINHQPDRPTPEHRTECNICAAWTTKSICWGFCFNHFLGFRSFGNSHCIVCFVAWKRGNSKGVEHCTGFWLWLEDQRRPNDMNKWHGIFFIGFVTPYFSLVEIKTKENGFPSAILQWQSDIVVFNGLVSNTQTVEWQVKGAPIFVHAPVSSLKASSIVLRASPISSQFFWTQIAQILFAIPPSFVVLVITVLIYFQIIFLDSWLCSDVMATILPHD